MKYRPLGATELEVSEVAFGVWTMSTEWRIRMTEEEGARLLQQALDEGITFFETADIYDQGLGETILARAFPRGRNDIVIATKFGYDFYTYHPLEEHRGLRQNFNPEYVRYVCEQSLRRLRTDYIDLYQLHNPPLETLQQDELFDLLEQLVKEGKVRYYGVALGSDIGWSEEGVPSVRERRFSSLQLTYNLLEQEPARTFFPIAEKGKTGLLARTPHASEVLTDKFTDLPAFVSGGNGVVHGADWLTEAMEKRRQLLFLAQETGRSLAQAAIKFCLAQPTIAAVLPDISDVKDLREYAAAPETPDLTSEELAHIDDLVQNDFYLERPPGQTPEPAEATE